MTPTISLEEFRKFAQNHNVIPVARALLADSETPLTLYKKLTGAGTNTFLLESAEHGGTWSRYSFIGVASRSILTERNGVAEWEGVYPSGAPRGIDPLEALRISATHLRSPKIAGLPPLTGGLVGYLGYDVVRRMERVGDAGVKDIDLPELAFLLTSDLAVLDHHTGTITLIANAINWDGSDERIDEAYADCLERLDAMQSALSAPTPSTVAPIIDRVEPSFSRSTSESEFCSTIEVLKEEIRSGEAFQIVLSQRFAMPYVGDTFDIYRTLRRHNPSPYMYYFRFADGLDVVGSSPEALVKVTGGEVMIHPIAGTRPRSADPERDQALAAELLADPKERAEHLMLVDMGRNDLGRVCAAGSVEVVEFMHIERYSHVMHIVSTVIGQLKASKTPVDALYSVFPAGTLSGAPKPRAMQLIAESEPIRRGIYGGTIGYLDFTGNIDTCIAIRTAIVKDGVAYVQAGAGIVADSDPHSENQETLNKAAAVLGAIATAARMSELQNGVKP